jgi:hypothetical protein
LVSNESQALLEGLAKRRRSEVFGGASPDVVDEFIATPRPVRTWYDTEERTSDGLPMVDQSFPGMSGTSWVKPLKGDEVAIIADRTDTNESSTFSTNAWAQASHLTLNVVWAMDRVFIVVDPTRFKGISLGQLADFVAMSGLAQIRVDAQVGDAPTILTLFDKGPGAASPGLTDWDRAFLKCFYSSQQKSILQRSEIANGMVRAMSPSETAAAK